MGTVAPHPFLLSLHLITNIIKLMHLLCSSAMGNDHPPTTPFDFSIEHESTDPNLDVRAHRRFALTSPGDSHG